MEKCELALHGAQGKNPKAVCVYLQNKKIEKMKVLDRDAQKRVQRKSKRSLSSVIFFLINVCFVSLIYCKVC